MPKSRALIASLLPTLITAACAYLSGPIIT
jgi:hypothetical protein